MARVVVVFMANSTLRALFLSAPLIVPVLGLAGSQKKERTSVVPEVGEIARPIGPIEWMAVGGGRGTTELTELRGKVVLVLDYGYYCDSCTRVGVPLVNALREANGADDLHVLHLTAAVGDDTAESIRAEAEKLGLAGMVGIADVEGESSPYLNMNANGNLTYAFVIGRHGGIVWKGDPSRKRDECVAAVGKALHALPCAPLPKEHTAFGVELADALRAYVLGDVALAESGAEAVLKKNSTKSGADAERVREEAKALKDLVESTRKELMDELERSAGEKHAERFSRAVRDVRRAFAKGPCADRAGSLEMFMTIQSSEGPACKAWSDWYELAAARPATFPAERTPATTKYARTLAKHAEKTDAPGAAQAKAWLERFARASERK